MRMMKRSLFIASVFALASTINAQERVRTIYEHPSRKTTPISILKRQLGEVTFNEKNQIVADSNWLKDLTLEIKNISDKNVSFFEITLLIQKQGKMSAAVGFTIWFGLPIRHRNGVPLAVPKGKVLAPNETLKVGISEVEYTRWTNKLKEFEAEDFNRVILNIRQVRFEDGTIWY